MVFADTKANPKKPKELKFIHSIRDSKIDSQKKLILEQLLLHLLRCSATMQLIRNRMNTYTDFFKALSDETRLRILNLLVVSEAELCVCEFTDILETPTYNVSKHLKILKNTGLLNEKKEGRWVYFGLVKTKEKFLSLLFEAIKEIPEQQLKIDLNELQKRFDIRVEGKCLLGVQKKHLKPINT
ncbi:hypothetical protein CMV00_19010 [Elizabethkingia anophelis]|nr:hypothetical protein [Elizabethkingia anophelis]